MRRSAMRQIVGAVAIAVMLGGAHVADAREDVALTPATSPVITRRVVVSLPHRKLAVFVNGQLTRVFDVAVGSPKTPSPVGRFTIVNRLEDPTYYRPGKVIGPGASNPLGTRWLGFDLKGYGIHGTDDPRSIGHARSHGCIRLRNSDVEELFEMLRAGDVVELHDEQTPDILTIFGN
jgi:lipoprotein-anchoring transpeptidase ErfK/SrfK